ncbi:MAG: NAD(P)/FAD-dependent oxidoreductase [Planctomycetota bacterium]|jgi:thioredoxin reductase
MSRYDVAVIGGGPAGLSASLVLARARWKVVVFNAGVPRNVASPAVQGSLSRDGTPPGELKRRAREQIERYGTVDFRDARVKGIDHHQEGDRRLSVHVDDGDDVETELVVLATGMIDVYPELEGFDELWGHRIIHCAYCHGWENADRPWGVIARRLEDVQNAPNLSPWADDILVFADPKLEIPEQTRRELKDRAIPIEQRAIRRLVLSKGDLTAVELDDGERLARGTLVYRPQQRQARIVTDIGVKLNDNGFVVVDEHRQTSIPGVYAGGDLTQPCQDVLSAAAAGAAIAKRMTGVLLERASSRAS